MKEEINLKQIIICSIIVILVFVLIDIFVVPKIELRNNFLTKKLQRLAASQDIAPQRLFINIWRTAKNVYVDSSLNKQDWNRWRNRYKNKIKTYEDADIAVNTMLLSLNDPYTKFLPAELYAKQKLILDSKITGIGITFNTSGDNIIINRVLENSPAREADILPGDIIVSINNKKVNSKKIEILINNIEDSHKDTVELVILRNNVLIKKKLKKKEIPIKTMDYKITEDNIGIITIANIMGEKAVKDFKDILEKTNDTKALIIDLRENYGGILANAIVMVNYMLDVDEIVRIESRINTKYQIYSAGERIFNPKPLIVLVNRKTASAAEVFAGALKVHLNAVLLGENTFGKNTIQQVIPIHSASGLIITTDKYILPDGSDISRTGLIPDVYVKQSKEYEDAQKDEALKILRDNINKNTRQEQDKTNVQHQ